MKKIILFFSVFLFSLSGYSQSVSLGLTPSMDPSGQHVTIHAIGETLTNYTTFIQYDSWSTSVLNPGVSYVIGVGDYDDFCMNSTNYFVVNGSPTQQAFMVWTNSLTPITAYLRFVCYDSSYTEMTSEIFEVTIYPDPWSAFSYHANRQLSRNPN